MTRLDYFKASPDSFQAILALESFVSKKANLEPQWLHLLKIRASQINGCGYCLDMHIKEARKSNMPAQWIDLISVWRESPIYTAQERALLAWTETVTKVSEQGVPDPIYQAMISHFTEEQITKLTLAIGVINIWNRLAVSFQVEHPVDSIN